MAKTNTASALSKIESLVQQGLVGQAEANCRDLLVIAPRDAVAWAWLGVLTLQSGRFAEAESAFRRATMLAGGNASYWSNL